MGVTITDNQPVERTKKIGKILEDKGTKSGLCSLHDFLNHFANKWSMLVILHLGYAGRPRFGELKSRIPGISQRMLTVTLRALESDGLVSRELFAEIPPRVEYELTPLGKSLLDVMMSLGEWASKHGPEITKARNKSKKKERWFFCKLTRAHVWTRYIIRFSDKGQAQSWRKVFQAWHVLKRTNPDNLHNDASAL